MLACHVMTARGDVPEWSSAKYEFGTIAAVGPVGQVRSTTRKLVKGHGIALEQSRHVTHEVVRHSDMVELLLGPDRCCICHGTSLEPHRQSGKQDYPLIDRHTVTINPTAKASVSPTSPACLMT